MDNETRQKFLEQIEAVEGRKYKMYMLDDNIPHIGIGHNIVSRQLADDTLDFLGIEDESDLMTATLNDEQCEYLFFKDLDIAINDARKVINDCGDGVTLDIFGKISEERQEVLIDMSFNLGRPRFKKFKKMIKAVQDGDFDEASVQILDSNAARDPKTAKRYANLAERMKGEVAKIAIPDPEYYDPEKHSDDANTLIAEIREKLNKLEEMLDS